jgi:hypothetical protein
MHQEKEVRHDVDVAKSVHLDHVQGYDRQRPHAAAGAVIYDQDG